MPRNDPQQNGDHESPTTSLEADMKQLELGNALQPTTTMHDHQEDPVRRIRNEITKLLYVASECI